LANDSWQFVVYGFVHWGNNLRDNWHRSDDWGWSDGTDSGVDGSWGSWVVTTVVTCVKIGIYKKFENV